MTVLKYNANNWLLHVKDFLWQKRKRFTGIWYATLVLDKFELKKENNNNKCRYYCQTIFFYHTRHDVLQLDSSIKCSLFKNTLLQPIIYDYYIRKPEPIKYQKYIPRFRLSMQQLAIIETGRSDNCEQQNRKCFLCSYFVENKSYLNMSFKRSITLTH